MFDNFTSVSPVPEKAYPPIQLTFSGICISVRERQSSNAESGISLILSERVTLLRFLQFLKAPPPISVTLFGISIEIRLIHSLKASSPIFSTLSGIFTFFKYSLDEKHPSGIDLTP